VSGMMMPSLVLLNTAYDHAVVHLRVVFKMTLTLGQRKVQVPVKGGESLSSFSRESSAALSAGRRPLEAYKAFNLLVHPALCNVPERNPVERTSLLQKAR
jgi:hypothetical protein